MFRIILLALFAAAGAFGQTASITGRVTDPNGAVVPGAHVSAMSKASGARIQQFDYLGGENQRWILTPTKDGYYQINKISLSD